MRWLFCEQAEPLTALYAVIAEPTPALTASANGHRYNSWSVRSSDARQSSCPSLNSGAKHTNVGAIPRLEGVVHAVHFLLVAYQVLYCRNDTLLLDALDGQGASDTLDNGIRAEPLPVAATQGLPPQGTNRGPEIDIGTLAPELFAQRNPSCVDQVLVPGSSSGDSSRKGRDAICRSNAQGRVLKTQLRKAKTKGAPGVSHTGPRWSAMEHEKHAG